MSTAQNIHKNYGYKKLDRRNNIKTKKIKKYKSDDKKRIFD